MNSGWWAVGGGQRKNRQRQLPGESLTRQLTLPVLVLTALCFAADSVPVRERTIERLGVTVRARIEPTVVPITDLVTLSVSVEGAAPLIVEPVKFGDLPGWRIRSTGDPRTEPLPEARERREQVFRLVPDRPGELTLSLPVVRARPGGRESWVELGLEPLSIRVTTALPRVDLDEARIVTGPEAAPPAPPSRVGLWLAAFAAAAGTLVVFWRWRIHRAGGVQPEPSLTEWLGSEIARLATIDPVAPSAADSLGDVVRGYLARRYQVVAAGRTTGELVALLPVDVAAEWEALLERCDLAKFARAGFTAAEWEKALNRLRESLSTLPAGEPPSSADTTRAGQIT
jgi:hypothetical protein